MSEKTLELIVWSTTFASFFFAGFIGGWMCKK